MLAQTTGNYRNQLLNLLSEDDREALQPHLSPVALTFRQRLQGANRKITDIYFIERGLASVVAIGGGERRQAEVSMIGREGMTGCSVVFGVDRTPCDVFMQVAGSGQHITVENFQAAVPASSTLSKVLKLYTYVFNVQGHYTALANARGSIPERLARWLLMAHDRSETDRMLLTHEFLALMLGVRRAGVTTALKDFEVRGFVETARGCVTMIDRGGLEEEADGLYGVPEAEYERWLS